MNQLDDLKRYLELSEYVEFTDSKGRLLHSIKSEKLLLPFLAHEQLQSKLEKACEALELTEKYLTDRGIRYKGETGRTIVLPKIDQAIAEIRKKE